MDNPISRAEHNEFAKRMEEEHNRQNHRISLLEGNLKQINELTISVKEMAVSMKQMLEELREQGDRLEKLEGHDGEMWRKVVGYAITAIVGIVIGFVFNQIGM